MSKMDNRFPVDQEDDLRKINNLPTVKLTTLLLENLPPGLKKQCYLPTVKLTAEEVLRLRRISETIK